MARSPWMLLGTGITDALMHTGLDLVWMLAVIEVAGPRRVTQYMAVSATLAGVRGVIGPLLGALVITHVGVQAVYLLSGSAMVLAVWLVGRELRADRLEVVAPSLT